MDMDIHGYMHEWIADLGHAVDRLHQRVCDISA